MATFTQIQTAEDLINLFEKSKNEKVLLFKHSLTCPISADAYQEMSLIEKEVHLIIVQNSRELSNAVAEDTGIRHESPQLIILENEEAVYNASHYRIEAQEVEKHL